MAKYRDRLPQLSGERFITDGGLETTLIFENGFDLPEMAAFVLLKSIDGRDVLESYYRTYIKIARDFKCGFILESPTWRASTDWGRKLGYSDKDLSGINHQAIGLLRDIRDKYENGRSKMVISGCMGSRGDGYNPADQMTEKEAERYHSIQIQTFHETDADMVTAFTLPYVEEAVGIARAARSIAMPVVIGFTVETDGRLPTGQPLKEAIQQVDEATESAPEYFMINCAHPTHFLNMLDIDEPWLKRIRAVRANASAKSHAELDDAEELDEGDPVEFGHHHNVLKRKLDSLNVFGGCCGTDHRHVEEICKVLDGG